MVDMKVIRNAAPPSSRPGPDGKWSACGFDKMPVHADFVLTMDEEEAYDSINSLRCHIRRIKERLPGSEYKVSLHKVRSDDGVRVDGIVVHRSA